MPQSQTEPCELMYHLPGHQLLFFTCHVWGTVHHISEKNPLFGEGFSLSSEVLLLTHFFGNAQKAVQDGLQFPIDLGKTHI